LVDNFITLNIILCKDSYLINYSKLFMHLISNLTQLFAMLMSDVFNSSKLNDLLADIQMEEMFMQFKLILYARITPIA